MEEWRKISFLEQVKGGWALLKNNTFLKGRYIFSGNPVHTHIDQIWDKNILEYVQVRSMFLHIPGLKFKKERQETRVGECLALGHGTHLFLQD